MDVAHALYSIIWFIINRVQNRVHILAVWV